MPALAGALTRLGLLALPAIPSPSYFASKSVSDTWSLSISTTAAVSIAAPISSGADTWSLSFTEAASSITTYPHERTELYVLGLPGKFVSMTAKAVVSLNTVGTVDGWSLTWTEAPTDTVTVDTWDTWLLSFTLTAGLSISQTFAASEAWGLQWLDTSSVLSGAPVSVNPTDTWSLTWTEAASAVAVTIASAGDTLSLSWTDSSALAVTQIAITGSNDTWSLTQSETAFVGVLATVPILASDQWNLSVADVSQVSKSTPPPPDLSPGRVILVRAQSYIVRVR